MSVNVPSYVELLWPTLQAAVALGGSASNTELDEAVIEREGLSEAVQGVLHGNGPGTEVVYRLAWARTYLKGMGLLANDQRTVWSVTEGGSRVAERDIPSLHRAFVAEHRRRNKARKANLASLEAGTGQSTKRGRPDVSISEDEAADERWRKEILETVLGLSPTAFERLSGHLLKVAGYKNVEVTRRSGDGGIDGVAEYQELLISHPLVFQSKRYRGAIGRMRSENFRVRCMAELAGGCS
ncbi:restriction system protein [Mycobacteroides chelonae]|nr:restriction system protein [Mycobacteroides chelonae]